jgi:hypothetical protein
MRLITHYGQRADRPQTPQAALWRAIRTTPYRHLAQTDKARLRDLLAAEHAQREQVRFGRADA